MTDITKGYKVKSLITFWLSVALNVVPMVVFFIAGFGTAEATQKVVLSFTAIAALVLGLMMVLTKAKIGRSIFWIVFLIMYFCCQDLLPIIIAMGACTIVDELIVSPLHKRFNTDYHSNLQIDKRFNIKNDEAGKD